MLKTCKHIATGSLFIGVMWYNAGLTDRSPETGFPCAGSKEVAGEGLPFEVYQDPTPDTGAPAGGHHLEATTSVR